MHMLTTRERTQQRPWRRRGDAQQAAPGSDDDSEKDADDLEKHGNAPYFFCGSSSTLPETLRPATAS